MVRDDQYYTGMFAIQTNYVEIVSSTFLHFKELLYNTYEIHWVFFPSYV